MGEATALRNDRPPAVGDVIAEKYRVESVVGTGGMGVVLAARHLQLGQSVAIKVLSAPEESRRVEANTRFIREAQAAAVLRSDHVVRIYDVGTLESGLPFMVMELLRGSDLGSLLDVEIKLDQTLAVDFVLQACDAISEAHGAGIVHRDLKPSNLFVTERSDGSPLLKVLDFGISKSMSASADGVEGSLTSTRAVMGSPYYMSPEQVRDARRVDGRTDIWALGVILHESLTGEPAFQADTFPGVCAAIVADPPITIHSRRPDVHPDLEAIVMRCLEKDPTRRFQSVQDLIKALKPFSSRAAAGSGRHSGGSYRSARVDASPSGNAALLAASVSPDQRSRQSRSFVEGATLSSDEVPSNQPRSSKAITGDTKTQLSADLVRASETEPAPKRPRRWLGIVAATAVVTFGALVTASFLRDWASVEAVPSAVPAAPPAPPPASTTVVDSIVLSIDSTPAGAEVFEGSVSLGPTPLKLTIASPEAGKLRVLQVRKQGFKPYSLEQGPARGEVRVHAALVPDEPAVVAPPAEIPTAAPPPARRPATHSVPAKKPPASTATHAPAGDIRLQR